MKKKNKKITKELLIGIMSLKEFIEQIKSFGMEIIKICVSSNKIHQIPMVHLNFLLKNGITGIKLWKNL